MTKSRWVLPEVVNPATSTCWKIPVPNDRQHKAAFMGAIFELAKAYSWQDDSAHTAKDVAAVWKNIFNNLSVCDPMVQFRQSDICILQASFDGGATWSTIYDGSVCATNGANQAIQDLLDNGTLAPGLQQPPIGGSILPGTCHEYQITLQGSSQWISPVPVEAGDIITITVAKGGWYDGGISGWNCPDGLTYLLGTCVTGTGYLVPADPINTVNHMRLIGNIPADTISPHFDMYNTSYTVPSGVALGDFYLQPNDSDISNNQGSITLKVQICKGGFTHTFDFAANDGEWSIFATFGAAGSYVSGQGWVSGCSFNPGDAYYEQIPINRTFPSRTIEHVEVIYDTIGSGGFAGPNQDQLYLDWPSVAHQYVPAGNGVDRSIVWNGSQAITQLIAYAVASNVVYTHGACIAGVSTIKKIIVSGRGSDPF